MWKNILVVGVALALVACQSSTATDVPEAQDETLSREQILILGEVSSDPAEKLEQIEPMVNYLAEQLAESGIKKVDVVVTVEMDPMLDHLKAGQVDLFFDNPYVALIAHEETGARPLLRRWRKGVDEYHSKIVVNRDSGMAGPDALLGQIIALDRPDSATGDIWPRAYLLNLGYRLAEKESADSPVAADEIGYVYAGSDDNVLAWILEGKTAGGAMQSDYFDDLEDDVKSQLADVGQTPSMPRHIVMAQAGLDKALEAHIIRVLTNMRQSPEGQAALKEFGKTDKFDQLPLGPQGTMQALVELLEPLR